MFRRFKFADGLYVLLLTAVSYLVAYIFQVTYLGRFGVSTDAIEITLANLVISLIGLVWILFIADQVVDLWRAVSPNFSSKSSRHRFIRQSVRVFTIATLSLIAIYAFSGKLQPLVYLFVPAMIFMPVIEVFARIVFKKDNLELALQKYYKHYDESEERISKKSAPSYTQLFSDHIAALVVLSVLAAFAGRFIADQRHDFFIVESATSYDLVLIQKNGQQLTLKKYDKNKKAFVDGYILRWIEGDMEFKDKLKIDNSP